MKVMLAIDGSSASRLLVPTAVARPWPVGTTFHVLSVIDLGRWEGMPALIDDARQEAQCLVKDATDKLIRSGWEASSEIRLGLPRNAVSDCARQWGADLIMVGCHGQSGVTRFLLGSVSQAVLRSSTCSVEIVRSNPVSPSPSDGMKLLLATDGSEASAQAVLSVANRPWPPHSRILIVSVVQLLILETESFLSSSYSEYSSEFLLQMRKEARVRAEEAIADARRMLNAAGSNLGDQRKAPVGEPRSVILDEAQAWGADLIVLGSRGRHKEADQLPMGSVAESVAMHAHCSVEVVRR